VLRRRQRKNLFRWRVLMDKRQIRTP
jgi:hypothetical protein